MFEMDWILGLNIIDGLMGGLYSSQFLKARWKKRTAIVLWMAGYILIKGLINQTGELGEFTKSLLGLGVIGGMQSLLFKKDPAKQVFTTLSLEAGIEISRLVAGALSISLYNLWYGGIMFLMNEGKVGSEPQQVSILMEVSNKVVNVGVGLLYLMVLGTYLLAICKLFIRKVYDLGGYESIFLDFPCLVAISIAITLRKIVVSIEDGITQLIYEKVPSTQFWIPLICFLLLGMIMICVMVFQRLISGMEEEKSRLKLESQIQQMEGQTREIQEVYEDIRGIRHDIKNHLEGIKTYITQSEKRDDQLLSYVGRMDEVVGKLDFKYRTGNLMTDIILEQKTKEAKKKGVHLEADFFYPKQQEIESYDMAVILNNALDNAIEACSLLRTPGAISLQSYLRGNLFFIEIENDFEGNLTIDERTHLPISHKEEKRLHGIGMRNIQKCVQKYKGAIQVSVIEQEGKRRFNLTMMMCGKLSHP